ncbi:anti-sigma-V factor rsiV [Sporosarcina sp.]|uniref:anti-sigma-V factor rsiV n=1 Tax=Sporosarcina sp. TaxID=49982 RepID=UPI00261C33FA|nr:anti-sigma-V factor rsiV [Sporosarcina sp.]
MKKMNKLKKDYEAIEIPAELEDVVKSSIRQAKEVRKKRPIVKQWTIGVASAVVIFIGSINMSPAMAQSMVNIPGLGVIVEVLTVQKLTVDEKTYQANLDTPEITGLENEELQTSLNDKYMEENKALFEQFEAEVAEMKKAGDGHLGIDTGYEVLTDTGQLLSIARYEVNTVGSSSTTMKYDTIDKQQNIVITLPSLFKDNKYIDVISSYIADEMKRQMSIDEKVNYFQYDGSELEFEAVKPNQNFYITTNNKLVISFDDYEVAPGYMGVVTFEIPSDILENLLVSDTYIN